MKFMSALIITDPPPKKKNRGFTHGLVYIRFSGARKNILYHQSGFPNRGGLKTENSSLQKETLFHTHSIHVLFTYI